MFTTVRGVLQGAFSQHTGSLLQSANVSRLHPREGVGEVGGGPGEGEGVGGL